MTTGQNKTPASGPSHDASLQHTEPKRDWTPIWAAVITATGAVLAALIAFVGGWLHYTGPGSAASPGTRSTASHLPALPPAPAARAGTGTAYLAGMNGQPANGSDPIQHGRWIIQGTAYPNSIGYDGTSSVESINYDLKGAHYRWFDVTVGVNDNADTLSQDTTVGFTVIMNPGNRRFSYAASWNNPASIHLPLRGAAVLTLQTDTTGGAANSLFPGSVAVWGSARLLP